MKVTQVSLKSHIILFFVFFSAIHFLTHKASAQEYYWSNGIVISGSTATGSVNGVGYTITSTGTLSSAAGIWRADTFDNKYNVPGDTGVPSVNVFSDSSGGTYTLTFDSPVESPLVAVASLGQVGRAAVGFNFGNSVTLLWTGSYEGSGSVTPSSGTTTSISGVEGYAIAKYSGTISSVQFSPAPETNGAMMIIVGFEVSTTPPEITAPGGTAGASSAAISVTELQTTVGDFDANKTVNWSIVGGADQGLFTINSSTGALSFSTAPNFLSPSDQDQNNVYEVQIRASDLQTIPQSSTQTVNVTVTDATAPVVSSVSVPVNDIYLNTENLDFTLNLSEQVTVDTTGGIPQISLDVGGATKYAVYQSGSGNSSLLFRYTVGSSDVDADGISINSLLVNGGTIQDAAGNNLNVTLNSVGNTSSVLVGHGSASQLVIDTQPVAAANGAALGTQPVLEIQDAQGNVVTTDNSTQIIATIGSGASGTLGGTATVTASSGVVTFSNLTLTGLTSETYTLSFDDAGSLTAVASSNMTLTGPGAASQVVLVTQPVFGPNGQLLTTQPVLQVQDAQGNVVTGDSSTQVTVSIGSGTGGTLGGTQTVTAVNGVITFTDLTFAGSTGENYTLAFSSTGGLTGATSTGAAPLTPPAPPPDTTRPTVTLSTTANSITNAAFVVTTTFSEAVTGFELDDLTISNGTASGFTAVSASVYTFTVTPTADGEVTVDIAANVAQDAATNGNAAATQLSVTTDGTAPTVALTTTANSPHSGVFTVTATFSEAVTGFALEDITVENGTAANLAGSGTTYTFDVTATADGAVTVDIAADVAQDAATNGNAAATQLSVTTDGTVPTVEITGPDEIVTAAFDVIIEFSEVVTGLELSEVAVVSGTAIELTGSGTTYVARIDPVMGQTVEVSLAAGVAVDGAGNPNSLSNVYQVLAGSPASEFEKYSEEIRQVFVDEAQRSLRSTISANQNLVRDARGRFVAQIEANSTCADSIDEDQSAECSSGLVSRNNVPFDVDGGLTLSDTTLSTNGTFFGQQGSADGTYRRLFFGDFDVQHDADTDSTTATLSARVAWEQMTSDTTMLGYFVGGELATSNISGAFEGDQDRVAVTVGGYAVHQLADELFLDGFLSYGIGRNNLEMANDVLALTSDYTTRTATAGAALSGIYEYERYEFRPELAFSYGKTWIGNVGFTGRAYGLVDDRLSLDAGTVSIANLTLRPEVVWALDASTVAESNSQLSFAPRAICERTISTTRTEHCGGGAELGLSSTSVDGLSKAEFRVIVDRVGSSNRSSFAVNLEHRF